MGQLGCRITTGEMCFTNSSSQEMWLIFVSGDNLLVGTRQGHLLLYGVLDGTGNKILLHPQQIFKAF